MRQLGELWPDEALNAHEGALGAFLNQLLFKLAELLGAKKLHLDHDPPLGARPQFRRGLGKKTYYEPPANDPHHLIYREKHAHHIKTNVRGEHGQHPDRVLIKRERKRQTKKKPSRFSRPPCRAKKSTWPKRPLRSANRWPKRRM